MKSSKILLVFLSVVLILLFFFRNKLTTIPKITFCDNFSYYETKIICYAFYSGNSSYCELVPNFKLECYSFATLKNLENCNTYEDKFIKAECIKNLAIKRKDPSECNKLKDVSLQETCFSTLPYLYYSFYSEDECKKIFHESARYTCEAIVKKNSSICKLITTEPWELNTCEALVEKDIKKCNFSSCYESFSVFLKNPSLCNYIDSPWDRAKCVAFSSKNFEYCKNFDGIAEDLCKLYVIKALTLNG